LRVRREPTRREAKTITNKIGANWRQTV
jgi:hypothetical protein